MAQEICDECGAVLERAADFCPGCGVFVSWDDRPPPAVPEPPRTVVGATGPATPSETRSTPEHRVAQGSAVAENRGAASDPDVERARAARFRAAVRDVDARAAWVGRDVRGRPAPVGSAPQVDRREPVPERREEFPDRTEVLPGRAVPAARENHCPACGRDNPASRRFCRHCAHALVDVLSRPVPPTRRRVGTSWWRRLLGRTRTPAEDAAVRAFRRSLPVRYTLFRGGVFAVVAVLLAGVVLLVRQGPVSTVLRAWDAVRGTTAPVVVVATTPDGTTTGDVANLTDGVGTTAWTTDWAADDRRGACAPGATGSGVVLQFADGVDVRRVGVAAGIGTNPQQENRPAVLELRGDTGCTSVELTDTTQEQFVDLPEPLSTGRLRVGVVDVYTVAEGGLPQVSLSEIRVFSRPVR